MFAGLILCWFPIGPAQEPAGSKIDPQIVFWQCYAFGVDYRAALECRRMVERHRTHCSDRIPDQWREWWHDDMRQRYAAWDWLMDTLNEKYAVETRMNALQQLRRTIGDERYFAGVMPQVIPNYGDR